LKNEGNNFSLNDLAVIISLGIDKIIAE